MFLKNRISWFEVDLCGTIYSQLWAVINTVLNTWLCYKVEDF
jgi:hypothetical protein